MGSSALLSYIGSHIWAIAEVMPAIASYRLEKKKVENAAAATMRKALNRTRIFLRDPDFSDTNKLTEISDLWNDASEKVGVLDSRLGDILGTKSRFWSDHELFIALGKDKEVIKLNDVVSEIDRLYQKM
jgi:hypothetical protein